MRITGGGYRGRKIMCPRGIIRPLMDRVRESFFAILGDLSGCSFLDLYSGSGVIGIEAASRGANPVTLVERDAHKRNTLLKNVNFLDSELDIKIMPVEKFIRINKNSYDTIFLDPPFKLRGKSAIISSIDKRHILARKGRLIIHISREEEMAENIGDLLLFDKRRYGGSVLLFYNYP